MKWIILIIAAGLTACCPCRHLATEHRDSLRTVTNTQYIERMVRDTIYLDIPAQSEVHTVDSVSHLVNDYATSDARINPDGTLYHDLRTKPQTRPVSIEVKEVERIRTDTIFISEIKTNTVEVKRPPTWWQRVQMYGCWVLLGLLLIIHRKTLKLLS